MRVVRLIGDGLIRKDFGSDLKKGLKVCGNDFKYIRSNITKGLDSYDLLFGSHIGVQRGGRYSFSSRVTLRGWLLEPVFLDFLVERGAVDAQQAGSTGNIPSAGPKHL